MEDLTADLLSLLQNSCRSDLTLVCPDGEVQVHRLIMSDRSTVFSSLLHSDMEESASGIFIFIFRPLVRSTNGLR